MKINEIISPSFKELEFVCVNSSTPNATSKKNQDALYDALRSVPNIIVYRQDFSDEDHTEISMAVVFASHDSDLNKQALNSVKKLAKKYNVSIDLIEPIPDRRIDSIYREDLENLKDWFYTTSA